MANISCEHRSLGHPLASWSTSILPYCPYYVVYAALRGASGLDGMMLSWKMHLYVIIGAGNEQCHFLKDDPNPKPKDSCK